jgi:thioredoxin-like negative regulator of GroEL
MVTVLLAILLSSVTSEKSLQQSYAEAYKESVDEQKPLMVVVGAPWCPACNVLKESTITPMVRQGELGEVSLVVLDRDEEPELVEQLTRGEKMLPQIIVFSKDQTGNWKRRRLLGFQPAQPVRTLIRTARGS